MLNIPGLKEARERYRDIQIEVGACEDLNPDGWADQVDEAQRLHDAWLVEVGWSPAHYALIESATCMDEVREAVLRLIVNGYSSFKYNDGDLVGMFSTLRGGLPAGTDVVAEQEKLCALVPEASHVDVIHSALDGVYWEVEFKGASFEEAWGGS